ncbi:beta-ketoacyl synthase chain length factor [Pseudoxanthomonas sp. J31]|uniref:beta-ketoacyl synthase chain length factor n=1 Tax=Pseudoxanthomonas sp. J31 TaxID=935851 RepID=UPI0003F66418|nr:beta-ketoacyl synthase chain length factor [Pseudoxanthomonas sp. J31]
MTTPLTAAIEGIGLWAPGVPSWEAFVGLHRGAGAPEAAPARPAPTLLPPNERRRAPDTVLVALQAAQAACEAAGRDPASLPSVFTSTYGELAITDNMCATLARAPTEVSPTRFHNSVHNAAAGYWTIGTGAMEPATAISAGQASFAMGLVEALAQLEAGAQAVLLVAYDGPAVGPLNDVLDSQGLLGVALVLARPAAGDRLRLSLQPGEATPAAPPAAVAAGNAMAPALVLLEAIAADAAQAVVAAGDGRGLRIGLGHG